MTVLPVVPKKQAGAVCGVCYGTDTTALALAEWCPLLIVPAGFPIIGRPGVLQYGHAWMVRDYMPWSSDVLTAGAILPSVRIDVPGAVVAAPSATWSTIFQASGCHFADELFVTPAVYGADPDDPALLHWPQQMLDWWKATPFTPKVFNGLGYPEGFSALGVSDGGMMEQFGQGNVQAQMNTVFSAIAMYPNKTLLLVSSGFDAFHLGDHEFTRALYAMAATRRTFYGWHEGASYLYGPSDDTAFFQEIGPPDHQFATFADARIGPDTYKRWFRYASVTVNTATKAVEVRPR